ncbi:MAG: hypothetical protein A07HR60_02551 [uncultured archaeon A07HR60]|jgi:hypothetical protein|nr:MAG: hypothetical protein A07HR60_02551 [uncultured archaeon A07HR60]
MKIRGRRECQDCGTQWSYYDTGDVACPDCESLRSVGVDERTRHTDTPTQLDLTAHKAAIGDVEGIPRELVKDLKSELRGYLRKRGFINEGQLRPPTDTYLVARELLEAVDVYHRTRQPAAADKLYLLKLLKGADVDRRPPAEEVPEILYPARGIAIARTVELFRDDLTEYLDENPNQDARAVSGQLRERAKRIDALQGNVEPSEAEPLVRATRDLVAALEGVTNTSLASISDTLSQQTS